MGPFSTWTPRRSPWLAVQYLQYADQVERLSQTSGLNLSTAQIDVAADASREMARKFAETEEQEAMGWLRFDVSYRPLPSFSALLSLISCCRAGLELLPSR